MSLGEKGGTSVALDGWGVLEFRGGDEEIVYAGDDGTYRSHRRHPLLSGSIFLEVWKNEREGAALLLDHYGRHVYRLDAADGTLSEAAALNRPEDMDYGMARSTFAEADGRVLLIYEGGVICFDRRGNPLWRADHDKYDLLYEGTSDGLVRFTSEFSGGRAYRLTDGELTR